MKKEKKSINRNIDEVSIKLIFNNNCDNERVFDNAIEILASTINCKSAN